VHYRLPKPGEDVDEVEESFQDAIELIRSPSFWWRLAVFVPIALVLWRYRVSPFGAKYAGSGLEAVLLLVLGAIWLVVVRYGSPLLDATIAHRPWILASAENPPVRMVCRVLRVTSRRSVSEVVEEIAAALERGDPRPAPAAATWIGYDEGTR